MAPLRGVLKGRMGSCSRLGSSEIPLISELSTWEGQIETVLWSDGSFRIYLGPKGPGFSSRLVATGNVEEPDRGIEIVDD